MMNDEKEAAMAMASSSPPPSLLQFKFFKGNSFNSRRQELRSFTTGLMNIPVSFGRHTGITYMIRSSIGLRGSMLNRPENGFFLLLILERPFLQEN